MTTDVSLWSLPGFVAHNKDRFVLHSTVLSGRRLTISVPEVRPDLKARPSMNVLILHDGQNLFDPERAHVKGQTWRVAETADALIASGAIPPTVIVGIDHAGDRRLREFGHGAPFYARFVVREVLPYIRNQYDVRRDPAGTAMGGSSMGGLVTLQIATLHPDVFGSLLVFSPSVWWNRRSVLRAIRRPGVFTRLFSHGHGIRDDVNVWVSIGLQEGEQALADARRLRDVMLDMRGGDASRLRYLEDPDGTHSEASWAKLLGTALRDVATLSARSAPHRDALKQD
jgi:enterochelin esterase-like enzyme